MQVLICTDMKNTINFPPKMLNVASYKVLVKKLFL